MTEQYNTELITVDRHQLNKISTAALAAELPINEEQAAQIIDQFEYAELSGKRTHGYVRVPWLLQQHLQGHQTLHIDNEQAISRIDCGHAIGYLAANEITDSMKESSSQGVKAVIATDIFPTNTLSYYLRNLVQDSDTVGVLFGTTPKLVSPPGKTRKMLGTNPLAIGFQYEGVTLAADVTTAQSSLGELLVAKYWGDFDPSGFKTQQGQRPESFEHLYEGPCFTGSITTDLAHKSDQRLYALSVVIQGLLNTIVPDEENRGNLLFVLFDRTLLADGSNHGALIPGISPEDLPGMRSHLKYLEAANQRTVRLPAKLWNEISTL